MFIERDKEKECSEMSSSSRYHIKNYYEIHRTNLFGVNKKNTFFFRKKQTFEEFRMLSGRYKMPHRQYGKIPFELVLSINKVLLKLVLIKMESLKNLFKK